jgi:Vibrio phage DNA polymerase
MEFESYAQYLWWKALPSEERRKITKARHEKTRDRSDRRAKEREQRLANIAVFDVETPKFDNTNPDKQILPFLGVIYADSFAPIIIWEEHYPTFVKKTLEAFESLPGKWTIYAHNGGRFDWMFFLAYIRGRITFKGRGLMCAKLGRHELRDSWHILPTKLAAFQKDEFNYDWMEANQRHMYRQEIIDYCISDCRYLLRTVKAFLQKYGFVLTIGQAAMQQIKAVYDYDKCNERLDKNFRRFYFGGRVECLQGAGLFRGPYKLYDLNSAYPDAMANHRHPHRLESVTWRYGEAPNANTYFIRLRCRNKNALISAPV